MDLGLTQRVCIVTGSTVGIGLATAKLLAAEGAQVVISGRTAARVDAAVRASGAALGVVCDLGEAGEPERLVAETKARFGRIDVLVNNAGLSDAPWKAEEEPFNAYRDVIEVNLNACFVLAALVAPTMLAAGKGSVINIGSAHSFTGSAPNTQAAYVISKHGVVGLTRELGLQWAKRGVRVNAICPGYFETELTSEMFEEDSSGIAWITRNTPMRRAGELPELDGALLFLASDASSFVTAQTLVVDGGWTAR